MNENKEPAPDPEIPDELRNKLSKPKRPTGYVPKGQEGDGLKNKDGTPATPPEEEEEKTPIANLAPLFKKLAVGFSERKFYKTIIEEKDVKQKIAGSKATEWVRQKREVKIEVGMILGNDGLPYCTEAIPADETKRVRAKSYKDAPPMEANLGDLTPAFSEWLFLNHPYDFAVRYAARSTHIQAWAMAHTN